MTDTQSKPIPELAPAPAQPSNASVESLLIPDTIACALCGVSRAHWHRLRVSGKIGPQAVRLGRKVLYLRDEVIRWANASCPDARTWQAMRAMKRNINGH